MAWSFGDGFDLYAAPADMLNGYWDSAVNVVNFVFDAGRFTGSRGLRMAGGQLQKASGVNDAVHHFAVAFYQTAVISGSSLGAYIQLFDATTVQCTIVFRQDGAILLTSGIATGTVLATYTGAVTATNTWYSFEFEVVINNTTGSFSVRKNGNSVNDFSLGSLNTRGGTANNYANKIQIANQVGVSTQVFDDFFWRSDASTVAWMGDIRCYTRMPASDASVQFSRAPSQLTVNQSAAGGTAVVKTANNGVMMAFVATHTGTIASCAALVSVGGTGNIKAAIYDATRTTVLATSNATANPVGGAIYAVMTFTTPLAVIKGTTYHLAVDQDFSITYNSTVATQWSFTTAYASFPAASPTLTASVAGAQCRVYITPNVNADLVSETLLDALTSYVYDSTPSHADLYNIAAIGSAPASVIAVTTRAYMQKSDAGTRTAAVNLKSGATTVASPTVVLATSGWQWAWRTDVTDPNTSAAWTAAAVDAAQIGPTVIA